MTLAPIQARRTAERYAADQIMPGVNPAIDVYRRALIDAVMTLDDERDAMNSALANPMLRVEAGAGMLELKPDDIARLIDEAGPDYVSELLNRIETAAHNIRARLLKDEP
jgi:Mg/Co/Ni transporter MgtE